MIIGYQKLVYIFKNNIKFPFVPRIYFNIAEQIIAYKLIPTNRTTLHTHEAAKKEKINILMMNSVSHQLIDVINKHFF
jgi:hypothetical protein